MTTTALSTRRAALSERLGMDQAQLELIRRNCIGADAPDDVLELYLERCRMLGCDPFSKALYVVNRKRNVKDDSTGQWHKEDNWIFQSSIDLFRSIAEANGDYAGQLGPLWSDDGETWVAVWLKESPPAAAKVGVLRHTFKEPLWVTATYAYYVPRDQKGNPTPTGFWKGEKAAHQLAKCCEALALRKAFPQKLNHLFASEEMEQADRAHRRGGDISAATVEAHDAHFVELPVGTKDAEANAPNDAGATGNAAASAAETPPPAAATESAKQRLRERLELLTRDPHLTPAEVNSAIASVTGEPTIASIKKVGDAQRVIANLEHLLVGAQTEVPF